MSYNGGLWSKANDSNLLVDNSGAYVNKSVTGIVGIDNNLLYYDGCQGGLNTLPNASNYCSSKNMRLPNFSETRASSVNGVPSCSGWTWTPTVGFTNAYGNFHYVWNGTSYIGALYIGAWDNAIFRCVK